MEERKLNWLELRNYKNLANQRIDLNELNVFIGPNGAGKSNIIKVLHFLKDSLTEPEASRGITSFEDAVQTFGNTRILDGTVPSPATVGVCFSFDNAEYGGENVLELELLVQTKERGVVINKEFLSSQNLQKKEPYYFYKFHEFGRGSGVYSRRESNVSSTTFFERLNDVPVNELMLFGIDKLLDDSKFAPDVTPLYTERRKILDKAKQWQFYNANHMNLGEIRQAEPKVGGKDRYLSPRGTNLAAVLFNLDQLDYQFDDQINQAMKSILPPTQKVRATVVGTTGLNVEWRWQNIDDPFYLYDLSDGTIRMLCWACILLSPSPPELLVIEEPEIGLHISWLGTLADWIKTAAKKTQVIISTHSPSLLDKFTDQPENVLVFHPSPGDKIHYSVSPLSNDRLASWFANGYELGDLYRIGDPVVGGWPW